MRIAQINYAKRGLLLKIVYKVGVHLKWRTGLLVDFILVKFVFKQSLKTGLFWNR